MKFKSLLEKDLHKRILRRILYVGGSTVVVYTGLKYVISIRTDVEEGGRLWTFMSRIIGTVISAIQIVVSFKLLEAMLYIKSGSREERAERISEFNKKTAKKILEICTSNGGIYAKIGQHMSTMVFLLPIEYTDTLKTLQDKCKPSSLSDLDNVFMEETGTSIEDYFSYFDPNPIGVATLAQVHYARLKTGEAVAVKIQHKWLEYYMNSDLEIANAMVKLAKRFPINLDFTWLSNAIKNSIKQESDFRIEEQNMNTIRELSKINPVLVIPKVHKSTRRLLIMDYIDGVKIDDTHDFIKKHNIDSTILSREFYRIFSQLVFRLKFIHCDPHPGNIFIRHAKSHNLLYRLWKRNANPYNFEIVILDHGLCCKLSDEFVYNYAEIWNSMVYFDEKSIETHSKYFIKDTSIFNSHKDDIVMHRLFVSMLTGRPWDAISGKAQQDTMKKLKSHNPLPIISGLAECVTEEESQITKSRMRQHEYIDGMMKIFSSIDNDLLMVMKTNDLVRSITRRIYIMSGRPSNFLSMISLTTSLCSDVTYSTRKKQLLKTIGSNRIISGLVSMGFPKAPFCILFPEYWSALARRWKFVFWELLIDTYMVLDLFKFRFSPRALHPLRA